MGRYLKLLAESVEKRAQTACGKSPGKSPTIHPNRTEIPHFPHNPQSADPPCAPDLNNCYEHIKTKKHNNIKGMSSEFNPYSNNSDTPQAALCGKSEKSGKSPLNDAFAAVAENVKNEALNQRYILAQADGGAFLRDWGDKARAWGWTDEDLFALDPGAPLARHDAMGLVWLLQGQRVVALTERAAVVRMPSGAKLSFYRRGVDQPPWATRSAVINKTKGQNI